MKRYFNELFRLMRHRNYILNSISEVECKILNDAIAGNFKPQLGELLLKYNFRYLILRDTLIFI